MRGNPEVIDYLNMLIGGELAARDQYLIHSRMYEDWGLSKIYSVLIMKCKKKLHILIQSFAVFLFWVLNQYES